MYILILIIIVSLLIFLTIGTSNVFYADKQDDLRQKLQMLGPNGTKTGTSTKKGTRTSSSIKTGTTFGIKIGSNIRTSSSTRTGILPIPKPGTGILPIPKPGPKIELNIQKQPRIIKGQLKPQKAPQVNNIVKSYIQNDDDAMKSSINKYLSQNSAFKATKLTACNTDNPTLDDIICNLKFQYKIQSFI